MLTGGLLKPEYSEVIEIGQLREMVTRLMGLANSRNRPIRSQLHLSIHELSFREYLLR